MCPISSKALSNCILIHISVFVISNETAYLKVHYDMDILPDDLNTLPKYTSNVCKWHLFISNMTDDVFDCVKTTFEMDDYSHSCS